MELTESVEDYLRLVYELGLDGDEVGGSALAGRLGISAPSVTNMAKRLAKAGLIRRAPYRGLTLTEEGRKAALGVVRRHRLVELYLVEELGYSWDEVHEEAERIEHAVSEGFADRMDKLLGHPEVDAHGSPIPTKDGEVVERPDVPLAGLGVGERAMVSRVLDRDSEALRHLAGMGLTLGAELEVVERHPFDGPLILDSGAESLLVSRTLALLVFVEPIRVRREGRTGLPRRATLADGAR